MDWVDCGLAYRDRYIAKNHARDTRLRDSYRSYYQVSPGQTYASIADMIERIDFADGVWWVKGMMTTLGEPHPSERHPYMVERHAPAGDLGAVKERILRTGSRLGPYYGHDYIDVEHGAWPEELVKQDPDGKPYRYYSFQNVALYYKDNVRGLATGALKRHYERVLDACWLQPGDPLMLDTFTAYARPGYHPEYPATPQTETDAKREIARWLKYDRGLSVAGEALVEGTQDVVDYAAISYFVSDLVRQRFWAAGFPRKPVPLLPVIYHGSTYLGVNWYELREHAPNWAALLTYPGGLWDWGSTAASHIYEKAARYYWNQCIFWARVADAALVDVDQRGSAYTLRFDNGCVLWADPAQNRWWLQEGVVRYDGFTPFNNRGVMAILKQGEFDLVLPVREILEVIPSQPHRGKLAIRIVRQPDGRVRVRGNFSRIPWRMPYMTERNGQEIVEETDVPPVLMLRRVAPASAP